MLRRLRWTILGVFLALGCTLPSVAVADLAGPTGRVILTVSGSIQNTTNGTQADFDLALLESLGLKEVITETPWTNGPVAFQGVLVRDLIAKLGASGQHMRAVALDDYRIEIPLSDFEKYDAVLATRREGEPMRVRDKGPIWIIYPWTDHPELQNDEDYAKAIWQVRELVFE